MSSLMLSHHEITADTNSSIHQTVDSENDCQTPPEKGKEVQSKTAKALELILGKTPEVSEIDRLKQTVAKKPQGTLLQKEV